MVFFNFPTANKLHAGVFAVVINSFYGSQFLESFEQPPGLSPLPVMYRRSRETTGADAGQAAIPCHVPGGTGGR